jgi:hypothetical protein
MEPIEVAVTLTPDAIYTVESIQRRGESFSDAVNRILETLAPTAPDFDHFYGEPKDGMGPSGE